MDSVRGRVLRMLVCLGMVDTQLLLGGIMLFCRVGDTLLETKYADKVAFTARLCGCVVSVFSAAY